MCDLMAVLVTIDDLSRGTFLSLGRLRADGSSANIDVLQVPGTPGQ